MREKENKDKKLENKFLINAKLISRCLMQYNMVIHLAYILKKW